jgi:excisionase family DNA binding protein
MQSSDYVAPEDIAEHYGVSTETVRRWCREHRVPGALQLGRQWRIPKKWMDGGLEVSLGDEKKGGAHKI